LGLSGGVIRKRFAYRLVLAAYMAMVLVVSLRPMPSGLPEIVEIDKLYHFATYMVMAILLAMALQGEGRAVMRVRLWIAALMVSAYGAMVEVLQSFTGTRSADIFDAIVNGIGATVGVFIFGLYMRWKGARGG
jgi:VanZ family protein